MTLRIRQATREDIDAFSSMPGRPSLLAVVGDIDGRIVLMGGLAFSRGRWFAFLDITDEARPFKMTIARAAIRIFDEARKRGIRFVYAEADPNEPSAVRWLTSLGFKLDPRTLYLYRWES